MRKLVLSLGLSLGLVLGPVTAGAFDVEARMLFGPPDSDQRLAVISTGDVDVFAPVIEGFIAGNPGIAVDYTVASSAELNRAIGVEEVPFDIAISSAMDLQTKLVNDGFSTAYSSQTTTALPDWARWRRDLFAFTQEPAAIVLSRAAFADGAVPHTRQDVISALRQDPESFRGRVGTYDLRTSGLGYLFATQDSRTSEVYWRLTEVMGALDTRLYCCSSDMIDDVASGRLAIAYNVLASYALTRPDREKFIVLLPADFTTVMMRTALIPKNAANAELAGTFIDYLLRSVWNNLDETTSPLSVSNAVLRGQQDRTRRIRLGPELLVFLDRYKKDRFLKAWTDAVLQR